MSKTWFITGASSGFGKELVKAVLTKGDNVVATFRRAEQASAFSAQQAGQGLGIVMDVTNETHIQVAIREAISRFGVVDVLVNNAGYGTIGALEEFSMEEVRAQMETNFFGAVAVTQAFLPLMRERGSGQIVQISSQAGFKATPGFGLYNASKFALEGYSEALAQEVASFGIRVVIVEPGPFRTEFLAGSIKAAQRKIDAYEKTPVAATHQYVASQNGKQEGDPAKAAQAIVEYIYNDSKALRLPLGKAPLQNIRLKMAQVEADLKANEAIAIGTVYE